MLLTSGLGLRDSLLVALRPPFRSYEGDRERRGDIDRRCKGGGERECSRRGVRERMRSRPRDKEREGIAGRKLDGFGRVTLKNSGRIGSPTRMMRKRLLCVVYCVLCVLPIECDVKLTARLWIEPWSLELN